ncbi:MAG TPA: DUF1616 domain-containing protein [Dehalococcoidia bacterium]|nr:DUF1616 domain-containing protein [Dehalococcoidia bacterium]
MKALFHKHQSGYILSVVLLGAVLGVTGVLGYSLTTFYGGESFTEFYILGVSGNTEEYPTEIRVGEEAQVIVGIINHEGEQQSYQAEVRINGVFKNSVGPIALANEKGWEGMLGFISDSVGNNQKVEFLLFKGEETESCLEPLRLWVNVRE